MDTGLLPLWLLVGGLLPAVLGLLMSFWVVGKGNRVLWIVPCIVSWLLSQTVIGWLLGPKLSLWTLLSGWLVAGVVVVTAYVVRRLRGGGRPSGLSGV